MNVISRVFFSIFKAVFYSVFAGLCGFIITVSFINGSFPPTWNEIKLVKKKIETIANLKRDSFFKSNFEKKTNMDFKNDGLQESLAGDIEEINNFHKKQAKISQDLLEGEMTFASKPSSEEVKKTNEEIQLGERVRKLEDLVSHLQNQIQLLHSQINSNKLKK